MHRVFSCGSNTRAAISLETALAAAIAARLERLLGAGGRAHADGPILTVDLEDASGRATAAPVVRIEALGDDVIVSPPIGGPGPCRECWRLRRISAWFAARPLTGDGEAVVREWAAAASPLRAAWTPAQLDAVTAILPATARSLAAADREPAPLTLLHVVTPTGAVQPEHVLPRPDCAGCRPLLDRLAAQVSASPAEHRQLSDRGVGRAAGIVVAVREVPPLPGEPREPAVVQATLANTWMTRTPGFLHSVSGKGWTPIDATRRALGEALERYAACVVPAHGTHDMGSPWPRVDPRELHGLTPEQQRAGGYTDDPHALAWTTAVTRRGRPVLVPTGAAYLRLPGASAALAGPLTTNGLACAPTFGLAADAAFAELVERDRFFAAWYGLGRTTPLPRGLVGAAAAAETLAEFQAARLAVDLWDCGAEAGVHVVAARCRDLSRDPLRPAQVLGLGHGGDARAAAESALLEMGQVYRGLSHALRDPTVRARRERLARDPWTVAEPLDHALLFAGPTGASEPDRLDHTRGRDATPHPATDLPEPLFVDVTSIDMAAITPWRVVRAIGPRRLPYHVGEQQVPWLALQHRAVAGIDPPARMHPLC